MALFVEHKLRATHRVRGGGLEKDHITSHMAMC